MDTQTGRPVTLAPNGLVTSPHSVASAAGLDVLRAGGSAVDAAIATSAALSVLYPHMTSIGGGTALQRRDQVGVALGHTGPAFLQENAELEIDAPGVILRELLERIDALQPDIGIDLHMGAHGGAAMGDRSLKRRARAPVHILDREPRLHRRDPLHVIHAAIGRGFGSVEDARLVEMDVGLDQAAGDEAGFDIEALAAVGEARLDGRDPTIGDPDVPQRRIRIVSNDPRIAQYQIKTHVHSPCKFLFRA